MSITETGRMRPVQTKGCDANSGTTGLQGSHSRVAHRGHPRQRSEGHSVAGRVAHRSNNGTERIRHELNRQVATGGSTHDVVHMHQSWIDH